MAASVRKMEGVSDSSSSDEEELKRCQEAVWETQTNKNKDGGSNVKESKRFVVAAHEHDGNELQVTKGFQIHVAKKLEHFLDGCISEKQPETSYSLESTYCDEGFRLFSTSIPEQEAESPPAPARRRPVSSSSDSDSEMETRLKEAAVSVKDLLPSSTLPSTLSPSSAEPPDAETTTRKKKAAEEEESCVVRKKKCRKQPDGDSAGSAHHDDHEKSEQERVLIKWKKKKKRKLNLE